MTAKRILLMPRIWIRRSKAKDKGVFRPPYTTRTAVDNRWDVGDFCSSRHLAAYRWAVYGEAAEADGTYTIN